MAAIVRVKRLRDENQANSIVFICKKSKLSNNEETPETDSIESNFKFAGTIPFTESSVTQTVRKAITTEKLKSEYNKCNGVIDAKTKIINSKNRASQNNNKYNVISRKRANKFDELEHIDNEISSNENAKLNYFLIDVEKCKPAFKNVKKTESKDEITCNGVKLIRESTPKNMKFFDEKDYVYDIYYLNKHNFDYNLLENIEHIEGLKEETNYLYPDDPYREGIDYEEEDENEESNWRNDYPDENLCFYERDDLERYSDQEEDGEVCSYNNDIENILFDDSPEVSECENRMRTSLELGIDKVIEYKLPVESKQPASILRPIDFYRNNLNK